MKIRYYKVTSFNVWQNSKNNTITVSKKKQLKIAQLNYTDSV